MKKLITCSLILLMALSMKASHYMGGEITWTCSGGNYTFKTVLYRDCNGQNLAQPQITLDVANHPSVNQITCNLAGSFDISPQCTSVAGGPAELDCGTGPSGGNGIGAIEKFVFESNPTALPGTPPQEGWSFYWSGFSRSNNIDNIQNSIADGITLYATMFEHPSATDGACYDQSPQFGSNPQVIVAAGEPYQYNQAVYDPDVDSLHFSFSQPLDQITGGAFDPPNNPVAVDFATGFSSNNPTPDATFDPSNQPASIDPETGEISFRSYTQGTYVYSIKVTAYRGGQKISENIRDIQVAVPQIAGYNNNPPNVVPPLNGNTSFSTTVTAGDLVNFSLDFSDSDLLQDGTTQSILVNAFGSQFGNNFTNAATGCQQSPCATLNQTLPSTFTNNGQLDFNWQTDCDHLLNADGNYVYENAFKFVFRISDDYCQAPQDKYVTVKVIVLDKERVPAPEITCLQVQADGSVNVNWTPLSGGGTGFQEYQVNNMSMGTVQNEPNIAIGSYNHAGVDANTTSQSYNVSSISGCNGHYNPQSKTLKTMLLDLTDPGDGTVILQWSELATPFPSSYKPWYYVELEYPLGTWTLIDSVAKDETLYYRDTIEICSDSLNYRISAEHSSGCRSSSNIKGKQLSDNIAPYIPNVEQVSVDSATGIVDIYWDVNDAEDTYGYIVYEKVNGFWIPRDTIWGRFTTSYEDYSANPVAGALTYSVAAFDSCFTGASPPTYQTSAKSTAHTTIHLEVTTNPCLAENQLKWTEYKGWSDVDFYEVIVSIQDQVYKRVKTLDELEYLQDTIERGKPYCYYVVAHHSDGRSSFSNEVCITSKRPGQPSFNYLTSASVINNQGVEVTAYIDPSEKFEEVQLLHKNGSSFDTVKSQNYSNKSMFTFFHQSVDPTERAQTYKLAVQDTCGTVSSVSNIGRTMHLQVALDTSNLTTTVQWSQYSDWDGFIKEYKVYRGVDGLFEAEPIATLPPTVRVYEDDVSSYLNSEGQFCYKVEAVESMNGFGFSAQSFSNFDCAVRPPIIYIPNAFIIGSVHGNDVFKPVISLYEFESYHLRIYNRWGKPIYDTQDPDRGWDGYSKKGELQEQGVYVYFLQVRDANGKIHERRGTVTLLNNNAQ